MAERKQRSKTDEHAARATSVPSATEAPARRKPGPRPGTEAAKRGGTAAREKYGREFYSRIGSKGGSTVRERHGSSFYTEIGRRGGESTKRNLGTEHYSRIGRIGGQRAHGRRDTDVEAVTSGASNTSR
jgi:general stress protein YciG